MDDNNIRQPIMRPRSLKLEKRGTLEELDAEVMKSAILTSALESIRKQAGFDPRAAFGLTFGLDL